MIRRYPNYYKGVMEMKIIMIIYKFSGYPTEIQEFSVIKETEKMYIVKTQNSNKHRRIYKEEVGKVLRHPSDYCPYLRVFLPDATVQEAKEKIAEWFEKEAIYIRK